jgi:hypothetical protein
MQFRPLVARLYNMPIAEKDTFTRVPVIEIGQETNASISLLQNGLSPFIWCYVTDCGLEPNTCGHLGEKLIDDPRTTLVMNICLSSPQSLCGLQAEINTKTN